MIYQEDIRKDWLKKSIGGHNVHLGYFGIDDKPTYMGGGACHGQFSAGNFSRTPKYLWWDSGLYKNLFKTSYQKPFIDWFVNESLYAEAFLSKSFEEVRDCGYLCRTDLPQNFVIGAAIMSRFIGENYNDFSSSRKVYYAMIDAGISIEDAYIFSFLLSMPDNKIYFSPYSSGHTIFNLSYATKKTYQNYKNRNLILDSITFQKNGGYGGYSKGTRETVLGTFGETDGSQTLYKELSKIVPKSVVNKEDYHIFRKRTLQQSAFMPAKENIVSVVSQIKEMVYE